jgi:tetratricopeptide (TPR) repeat protein
VWFALAAAAVVATSVAVAVRLGWNPREPFHRNAPVVEQAKAALASGKHEAAQQALGAYLGTGPCTDEGSLALSDRVRAFPDASFDLALALFQLAESHGPPFGEEEVPSSDGKEAEIDPKRRAAIECGRIVALAVASDPDVPAAVRARASFVVGNLEFLRHAYEEAVKHYDRALEIVPAIGEKAVGDAIGRDVAHNRAIALRRIEDKKRRDEEKKKNEPPEDKDKQDQDKQDQDKDKDKQDQDKQDQDKQDQDKPAPAPSTSPSSEPEDAPEARTPPASRMLDDLREAPTYQEENAKRDAARVRRGSTMEDK